MTHILAPAAGLLCLLLGLRRADALRQEERRLTRWGAVLAHLALLLREGTLPLPGALRAAGDGPNAFHLPDRLLCALADEMESAPLRTIPEALDVPAVSGILPTCAAEGDAIRRMLSRLGRGSQESRILAVEQCAAEISPLSQEAGAKVARDAKLFTTLGWTGGAALTLLLIL